MHAEIAAPGCLARPKIEGMPQRSCHSGTESPAASCGRPLLVCPHFLKALDNALSYAVDWVRTAGKLALYVYRPFPKASFRVSHISSLGADGRQMAQFVPLFRICQC